MAVKELLADLNEEEVSLRGMIKQLNQDKQELENKYKQEDSRATRLVLEYGSELAGDVGKECDNIREQQKAIDKQIDFLNQLLIANDSGITIAMLKKHMLNENCRYKSEINALRNELSERRNKKNANLNNLELFKKLNL